MAVIAPYAADHVDTNGPGDARPTALKIVRDQKLDGQLQGKVFLITGCTSGIGVETARAIHATGADVYITGRNVEKGEEVAKNIAADTKPGKVVFLKMELDSIQKTKDAAAQFLKLSKTLNVLICNAGVMASPEMTTQDGFELQFGTNHVGHFALFQALKQTLLDSATPEFSSRVVPVTSAGHRYGSVHFDDYNLKKVGYEPFLAYGQSKTANIWMANEIERRYGGRGLHATSVHPGGIFTELGRYVDESFIAMMRKPEVTCILKSLEQGAATTVWAAVAKEWGNRGGRYLADCQEEEPVEGPPAVLQRGYQPHAYDKAGEKRLWKESLQMVGVQDDQ